MDNTVPCETTEDAGYHIKLHGAYLNVLTGGSIVAFAQPCGPTRHDDTASAMKHLKRLPDVWRSAAYIVQVVVVMERRENLVRIPQ